MVSGNEVTGVDSKVGELHPDALLQTPVSRAASAELSLFLDLLEFRGTRVWFLDTHDDHSVEIVATRRTCDSKRKEFH